MRRNALRPYGARCLHQEQEASLRLLVVLVLVRVAATLAATLELERRGAHVGDRLLNYKVRLG